DVKHECYIVPDINLKLNNISMVMISEAAPPDPGDYYYAKGEALFQQTTVQAFNDAGVNVSGIQELIDMGVYFTTAVKCGKTGYGIKAATINECSLILEQELALFPNVEVFMLMGDVAIKAVNYIAKRTGQGKVIPAGSTYKIRGQQYFFGGKRAFPSYLQAGPAFFIEKSKRRMIAEDVKAAFSLIKNA
ncbi:MAG: uracil-DNA glycosylase family protein, partial [Planctomycetota bacterium]